MKARDGDTQTKTQPRGTARGSGSADGTCRSCGAKVPAKPGFRLSTLKCPSCGTLMGKK
jgi:hypothetical protein